MLRRFEGRVVLVTGASRGIGAAAATRLAAEGADVAIVARTLDHHPTLPGSLTETAGRIRAFGVRAVVVVADLTDPEDRDRIVEKHAKRAKADITRFKGLGEMMPKTLWETTLDPKNRRLLRVEIGDALQTERVISDLMGKDPSARFKFIMDRAEEAEELDV